MEKKKFLEIVKSVSRITTIDEEEIGSLQMKDDLGIDSILLISLIVELESFMDTEIPFEKLQKVNVKTPLDLWELLWGMNNEI